ncbi:ComEC/Rec2 family competence protein [Clostridium luticellarii]|jgi:competence protein ComEC|uniref:ComEC family competence protein n=1 Tax=Clostridium luticellarii TaxID=1691940 RepID=A0A2T0BKW8_9CLOT|nr:ComEC/Rec2 family competence protein [Clostridium luticellarii]MCI1946080.1 MBL fold metallo-hydrolase [Clostridium luticellarii]MCI1967514.1 MBL fold metallo-hydrolase [Clostridium luticellarii]MCI1996443.1 MBL fold metallo-hydrolase [Clostridium luticellarii]MCI2040796.1 MBL fold metallo-hydrolase [Clostridium luticellarii]PRR84442.1 ComEC family competence protein [Clostridium luticellarii]
MNLIKKYLNIFTVFLAVLFLFSGCINNTSNVLNPKVKSSQLLVHYIDVGQGDSELIQINGKNLLIDAGPNDSENKLMSYLNKQNIEKLDYVIATHPDEDHIGGMSSVIKKYEIDGFYAPRKTTDTLTFEKMIVSLKDKNMKIDVPNPLDTKLNLGENITAEILAPNSSTYEDTNNYSIVLKITYGDTKFLFTGDAETKSESEMTDKNYDLSADVLKVGHHGSSSSTSEEFLDRVNPKIAVISCGKNNKYGHPTKKTINKLKKKNIQIYRTDVDGTILLTSDGSKISKE